MGNLKNLQKLYAKETSIHYFDESITQLRNLKDLVIGLPSDIIPPEFQKWGNYLSNIGCRAYIEGIKEPITTDPNDFEFEFLSNEEIYSQIDSFRLKNSNKYALINELSTWINDQAQKKGKNIPYPEIYQKTEKFVENSFEITELEEEWQELQNEPDDNIPKNATAIIEENFLRQVRHINFDFGFVFPSNGEIRSQFDSLRLKTSNKVKLIHDLSSWINFQAQKKGKNIPHPEIYQKTEKFVQNFFN